MWLKLEVDNNCPHLNTDSVGRCQHCFEVVWAAISLSSPLVEYMILHGIDLTRENYVQLALIEENQIGPELESEIRHDLELEDEQNETEE